MMFSTALGRSLYCCLLSEIDVLTLQMILLGPSNNLAYTVRRSGSYYSLNLRS